MYGFGIAKSTDNGFFMRIEYNNYDIEGKKVVSTKTDSKFTAELKDSSGDTTRISIGKSF